jgi:hypothetical protein
MRHGIINIIIHHQNSKEVFAMKYNVHTMHGETKKDQQAIDKAIADHEELSVDSEGHVHTKDGMHIAHAEEIGDNELFE